MVVHVVTSTRAQAIEPHVQDGMPVEVIGQQAIEVVLMISERAKQEVSNRPTYLEQQK